MVEVTTLDGIALVLFFYISYHYLSRQSSAQFNSTAQSAQSVQSAQRPLKSIMSAPRDDLAPPKDDPYTPEQLKAYDGADPDKPIYVAIKGTIFDVTHKADVYGAGKSYNIFAGKDASRGLGMSSLEPQNAIPDYSDLNETDMKVLNDWYSFFTQRYNIVGTVVDPATST
ncbi:cytochrome b5 [Tricholoma matsutake]|nr:cytochrome b5 [Tricholoma matsutake 945]